MAKEIERKFLVIDDSYRDMATSVRHIVQGYLSTDPRATVRVRIIENRAMLTVKGLNEGMVRDEWEYAIPVNDAREMLERLSGGKLIDKLRYIVPWDGLLWEVDCFASPEKGLVVAEVEIDSPDRMITIPPFVGEEVTGNPAYYNSSIAISH